MKNHFLSSGVSIPFLLTVFGELKACTDLIAWLDFKKSLFVLFQQFSTSMRSSCISSLLLYIHQTCNFTSS